MNCAMASRECQGRLEWHHAIKQQRLKRQFPRGAYRFPDDRWWRPIQRTGPQYSQDVDLSIGLKTLDDILGDERNRVWLCSHHHELVTNGRLEVPLPESVWEFAREFGLSAMLENDLARRAAA